MFRLPWAREKHGEEAANRRDPSQKRKRTFVGPKAQRAARRARAWRAARGVYPTAPRRWLRRVVLEDVRRVRRELIRARTRALGRGTRSDIRIQPKTAPVPTKRPGLLRRIGRRVASALGR